MNGGIEGDLGVGEWQVGASKGAAEAAEGAVDHGHGVGGCWWCVCDGEGARERVGGLKRRAQDMGEGVPRSGCSSTTWDPRAGVARNCGSGGRLTTDGEIDVHRLDPRARLFVISRR